MPNKKKNKKGSSNGFIQFALELRDKHPQKYRSLPEAVAAAGPQWPRLPADQRAMYDERAKLEKQNCLSGPDIKYDSNGIPLDEIERQEDDKRRAVQVMKNETKEIALKAKQEDALASQTFLIVHFNVLFETNQGRYYSCEVAIAPFSLENGVNPDDVFHFIIKPGELPLGYMHEAKQNAEEHQLLDEVIRDPIEDNTSLVFKSLVNYMGKYKHDDGSLPILYARADRDLERIQTIIGDFCDDFNYPFQIRVYSLEFLFMTLKNCYAPVGKQWPNETFSYAILERDPYSHTQGLSCDFHETADVTEHCSRARVIRYVYLICDACCVDLEIPLVPGRHVPPDARVRNQVWKTASASHRSTSIKNESIAGTQSPRPTTSNSTTTTAPRRPIERTMLKFPPRPGQPAKK